MVPFIGMANGRPPGDESSRSSRRPGGRSANHDGLASLGRQMQTGGGEGSAANESGLRSLGARIDAASGKSRTRRNGKPRWSARKRVVVSLLGVLVLLVAVAGGSYGYLWYRYDQINKVHISDEVAVQSGAPFTILVIGSDSRGARVLPPHRLLGLRRRSPDSAATSSSFGG